jgi:hypothetical protein
LIVEHFESAAVGQTSPKEVGTQQSWNEFGPHTPKHKLPRDNIIKVIKKRIHNFYNYKTQAQI